MVALQLILDCHSFIIPNKKLFLVLCNGYDGESCALAGPLTIDRLTMRGQHICCK